MKVVGLTGGIGSGKTTVSRFFEDLGVPVYTADTEAKKVVHQPEIKRQIEKLLGKQSFQKDQYNTRYVSDLVFNDATLLRQLNAIIHPAVAQHFENWKKHQSAKYVIKEAAILFESGSYIECDKIILVLASELIREERILKRDKTSREEINKRMKAQWSDAKKAKVSDYLINNDGSLENLKRQVAELHKILSHTFS